MTSITLGPCTLIHGDCLEMLQEIQADAVITDPPYGAKEKTARGTRSSLSSTLKGGKNRRNLNWKPVHGDDRPFDPQPFLKWEKVVMWGANYYADKLPPSRRWLIWDKREGTTPDDNADVELAWCSVDGVARMHRQLWRGLCMRGEENGSQKLHPTQKPVALMAWCIEQAKVPEGSTVWDPYMGSGTTAIACIRTGRKFIGHEQDEGYFNTAMERVSKELEQGKLL